LDRVLGLELSVVPEEKLEEAIEWAYNDVEDVVQVFRHGSGLAAISRGRA